MPLIGSTTIKLIDKFEGLRWYTEKAVSFTFNEIVVGMEAQFLLTKAVTDDDIIGENIIVDFPAETGVIFHKCFDVFKALFVFGVLLDRTNAISGLVDSHYDASFLGLDLFEKLQHFQIGSLRIGLAGVSGSEALFGERRMCDICLTFDSFVRQ